MHYYKRNLGDYAKKTGRLTMLQHGAYTLLIDSCYDREVFPTLERAIEWTWASTEAEIDAVKFVLNRFFSLSENGEYVQDRILQELLEYHAKADTNKRIAMERETKRRENSTKREPIVNEPLTKHHLTNNQEPITNNHKPITNINTITPNGVSDEVFQDYLMLRKSLKAPVTNTVIKSLEKEGRKANMSLEQVMTICCQNGWRGFKADWMKTDEQKKLTPHQASVKSVGLAIFGNLEENYNDNIIDIDQTTRFLDS